MTARISGEELLSFIGYNAKMNSVSSKNVNKFFDVLEQEIHKFHFSPNKIFSCDETDVTTV